MPPDAAQVPARLQINGSARGLDATLWMGVKPRRGIALAFPKGVRGGLSGAAADEPSAGGRPRRGRANTRARYNIFYTISALTGGSVIISYGARGEIFFRFTLETVFHSRVKRAIVRGVRRKPASCSVWGRGVKVGSEAALRDTNCRIRLKRRERDDECHETES